MNASRWTVLGRRCLPHWTRGAALCLDAAVAAPLVPWRRNTTTAWCQGERSLFPEIEARKSGRLETKDEAVACIMRPPKLFGLRTHLFDADVCFCC